MKQAAVSVPSNLAEAGWLYLAVVIDIYSRLVVGWAMSERMTAELTCQALKTALWRRRMPQGVIFHSDRGSQYCSALSGFADETCPGMQYER